jgi:hypothetical protein
MITNRVGRGYSTHFKFEATEDGIEHVFKKLHPVQKANKCYCIVRIKEHTK